MNQSRRRPPRQSVSSLQELAFRSQRKERERAIRFFDLDIEQSYRDWMIQMLGEERGAEFLRTRIEAMPPGKLSFGYTDQLDLSDRERECMTLMACGYTRKQTGDILHLSFETVKQYLDRGRAKMRAKTNTQAAFIAILVGELDHALMREHLFRGWDSPGLARPGRPVAA